MYLRLQHSNTRITALTTELSASREETLKWVEIGSQIETETITEIVEIPGKTVTKIIENTRQVVAEKHAEASSSASAATSQTVALPPPDAHTFSISVYKPANLNLKDWQADFGLKLDALGAEVVVGGRGDPTTGTREYYGGLRWRL